MDPYDYRTLRIVEARCPDIQVQTVLAHVEVVPAVEEGSDVVRILHHRLRSAGAIEYCISHSFPWLWRLCRHEAVLSGSACTVRNTEEGVGVAHDVSAYLAVLRVRDGDVVTDEQLLVSAAEEVLVIAIHA